MGLKTLKRTGLLTVFLAAGISSPAARGDFVDWWLTPDQQGRLAFEAGDYGVAARLFTEPRWKALAFYADGDFESAALYFETLDSAFGFFYLGNALAHLGRLEESLAAYRTALAIEPEWDEVTFNLNWVQGLADLDAAEYEDAGGTGGKLGADDFVFSDRARNAKQTMTAEEAASQGLTDDQIEEIWMRRVQTTPAEFLGLKFAYQLQHGEASEPATRQSSSGEKRSP